MVAATGSASTAPTGPSSAAPAITDAKAMAGWSCIVRAEMRGAKR